MNIQLHISTPCALFVESPASAGSLRAARTWSSADRVGSRADGAMIGSPSAIVFAGPGGIKGFKGPQQHYKLYNYNRIQHPCRSCLH